MMQVLQNIFISTRAKLVAKAMTGLLDVRSRKIEQRLFYIDKEMFTSEMSRLKKCPKNRTLCRYSIVYPRFHQ